MTIKSKKISTFCKTGSGGTPSRSNNDFFDNGTIPWVKSGELKNRYIANVEEYITDIAVKNSSAKLVSKGSLLIAMYGATVGEISQLTFDATTNQAICNILPDPSICDVNYLYRFLEALKPYLLSRRVGGGQPNISQGVIKDLEVPLPSLEEQRRIASILDKAHELRQKRQQAIEKLDQLLQATFIDMFGDPITNPKGWEVFKSKELFQDLPRIGTTTPANGEGIPVVRVGELGQFSINFNECGKVQISETDFKKFELKLGDLVLARAIGSKNQLGKCSYFSGYSEPVCIDSHVMRLRPDSKKMHPLWFYFLLSSDQGKKILQSKGGATAVQFNINSAQVNDLDIALPSLIEQTKFVEIANKILKNKESHIQALEANTLLFSSLQNQAFSGNL